MGNVANHYKDRDPLETIKLVEDFFKRNNLVVLLEGIIKSEIGTYSSSYSLIKNGVCILQTSGKAVTEDYCKASGIMELYERYCNIIYRQAKENYDKHAESKPIGILDTFKFYDNLSDYTPLQLDYIKTENQIFKIDDQNVYGQAYHNIDNYNDTIYLNINEDSSCTSSTGMASGNTLNEALIQGISEIFERKVARDVLDQHIKKYYKIKISPDNQYYDTIQQLQKFGYDLWIYDFSYNTGLPVLAGVLLNKAYNTAYIEYSSSPIFEIALERILTELYQCIKSYATNGLKLKLPNCPKVQSLFPDIVAEYFANYTEAALFEESILIADNIIEVDHYNVDVFLDSNEYTNEDLLTYISQLSKKLGYTFYYTDNSLDEQLYAVKIIDNKIMPTVYFDNIKKMNNQALSEGIQLIQYLVALRDNFNNSDDFDEAYNIVVDLSYCFRNLHDKVYLSNKILNLAPYPNQGGDGFQTLYNICDIIDGFIYEVDDYGLRSSFYFPYLMKYRNFYNHLILSGSSATELQKSFDCYNTKLTEDDILQLYNPKYLFYNIYYKPYREALKKEVKEFK